MAKPQFLIQQSEQELVENQTPSRTNLNRTKRSLADNLALVLATCLVGNIKLAPGTWGSLVGVGFYLLLRLCETAIWQVGLGRSWRVEQIAAWRIEFHVLIALIVSGVGIWAADRAAKIINKKDPQQIVVDEVAGQFIALMFIPLDAAWWLILIGFVLFRFFDILKPYPINGMQELPGGFGIVVDDLVAGIYAAIVMSVIAAIILSYG